MDRAVVHYAHSITGRFPFIDGIAIFFASYAPYLFILAFIVALFAPSAFTGSMPLLYKKRRLQFVLTALFAILIVSGIIEPIINYFYSRARPFAEFGWAPLVAHEADPSFPSGHATFMFTLAASMWQLKKKWGQWFFACALLTGLARVYSLVHYPTDIIFGALLGILTVFFVSRSLKK